MVCRAAKKAKDDTGDIKNTTCPLAISGEWLSGIVGGVESYFTRMRRVGLVRTSLDFGVYMLQASVLIITYIFTKQKLRHFFLPFNFL